MAHHDHWEWPLPHRDLHHARDPQSVTRIVNQVTCIKLIFIVEGGTDMDLAALKIMPAKSLNSVWEDRFRNGWSWGWGKRFSWNGRRVYRFDDGMSSRKSLGGRRNCRLTCSDQGNKNKQTSTLF